MLGGAGYGGCGEGNEGCEVSCLLNWLGGGFLLDAANSFDRGKKYWSRLALGL